MTHIDRGYVIHANKSHPLADQKGRLREHRAVLYAHIGGDGANCHWCGHWLPWQSTNGYRGCVNVDHLNGDRSDNRIENLVPACWLCNANRSWAKEAPRTWARFVARMRAIPPAERNDFNAIAWLAQHAEAGLIPNPFFEEA